MFVLIVRWKSKVLLAAYWDVEFYIGDGREEFCNCNLPYSIKYHATLLCSEELLEEYRFGLSVYLIPGAIKTGVAPMLRTF